MRPAWAFWVSVGVLLGGAAGVSSLVATSRGAGPVTPGVVASPLPGPASAVTPVAPRALPGFVPTLEWALEGPAPLRAARLDRVRRFWGMVGELRCPTSSVHDCVVLHPALGETA